MRLWTNIFLPIKSPLEFLLPCKDETIVRKLNDTHKTNDSLLLPSAFADWVSGKLSLCLAADGADKSQKPLEIRTFRQKKHRNPDTLCIKIAVFLVEAGESNPRPKTLPREPLRAQTVVLFPRHAANRHAAWVGSFMGHAGAKLTPVTCTTKIMP